jgi:hypothetical protein
LVLVVLLKHRGLILYFLALHPQAVVAVGNLGRLELLLQQAVLEVEAVVLMSLKRKQEPVETHHQCLQAKVARVVTGLEMMFLRTRKPLGVVVARLLLALTLPLPLAGLVVQGLHQALAAAV